jgi:hypothetical protein
MKKLTLLTIALVFLSFPLVASANPSELTLKLKYTSAGSLAVDVAFDQETTSRCIARHRSAFYYEGDSFGDAGVLRRSTHSRIISKGRKSTSLRAVNLPGVVQKNGQDPILSVQVRLICSGEDEVTSNIEARFIRCGRGVKRVSVSKYFSELKKRLNFSR